MSSQNITKNISKDDERIFNSDLKKLLNDMGLVGICLKNKCDIIIKIFTLLNTLTFWIDHPKYINFKAVVSNKCYSLTEELNREHNIKIIEPEKFRHIRNTFDTTLKLTCCNKKVKGRYCKNNKVGEYCTFHTNIKKQISHCVLKTIDLHIFEDISNIILEYVSL
jgi:hypothetical protein